VGKQYLDVGQGDYIIHKLLETYMASHHHLVKHHLMHHLSIECPPLVNDRRIKTLLLAKGGQNANSFSME
jgi:hypothetical protein